MEGECGRGVSEGSEGRQKRKDARLRPTIEPARVATATLREREREGRVSWKGPTGGAAGAR